MSGDEKIIIAKKGIVNGSILTFKEIFEYATRKAVAARLGMNYTRFRNLVNNPAPLRYKETYAIAKILDVPAKRLSELIHNQLDAPKPVRKGK